LFRAFCIAFARQANLSAALDVASTAFAFPIESFVRSFEHPVAQMTTAHTVIQSHSSDHRITALLPLLPTPVGALPQNGYRQLSLAIIGGWHGHARVAMFRPAHTDKRRMFCR
jgi:hypothetical protein